MSTTVTLSVEAQTCGYSRRFSQQQPANIVRDIANRIRAVSTGGFKNVNVSIALTVQPDGLARDVTIVKGSGDGNVDLKALTLVKQASPFMSHAERLGNMTFLVTFVDHLDGVVAQSDFSVKLIQPKDVVAIKDAEQQAKKKFDPFSVTGVYTE